MYPFAVSTCRDTWWIYPQQLPTDWEDGRVSEQSAAAQACTVHHQVVHPNKLLTETEREVIPQIDTQTKLLRIIVTGLYEIATDVLKRLEQFIYDCTLKRIYFVVDNIISQISIFKMLELFWKHFATETFMHRDKIIC